VGPAVIDTEQKDELTVKRPKHLSGEDEAAINAKLDRMESAAKADKAKVAGDANCRWKHYQNFYLGGANHWADYDGTLTLQFTDNRIGRNVNIKQALISELKSSAEFQPREPGDEVNAALKNAGLEYLMERQHIREKEERMSLVASVIGTGIGKVVWDADAYDGRGEIAVFVVPSEDFYIEPGVADLDDARYVFYERWMDPAEIELRWGIKPKDLQADSDNQDDSWELENTPSRSGGKTHHIVAAGEDAATTTTSLVPAPYISDDDVEKAKVQEWFIRENTYDVTAGEDGKKRKQKKYPGGRMIVRVGRHIVEDKPNPYEHGRWPYYHMVDVEDPKRFWGDTTVRQAIPLQKALNLVVSLIQSGIDLNTNTPWVNYAGSGIPNDFLQAYGSTGNTVFNCRGPHVKPERLPPPGVSGDLFQWLHENKEEIDKVMRVQDVIPPGARGYPASGDVVERLQDVQMVEIRQAANLRARGVRRRTELIGATMQQFYKDGRYVRLVGPLPRYLEGFIDPNDKKREKEIVRSEGDNLHYVKMSPDNMKRPVDTKIVESTYEPQSWKAQVDSLIKLHELDPEAITVADIVELKFHMGPIRDIVRRRQQKREEAAQEPPPEPMMPPDPMMQGAPPDMGMGGPPMMPGPGMPPMMPPMMPQM
jgi:hypothetical protein